MPDLDIFLDGNLAPALDNKSTRQRQDLLHRAWPDMAAAHAPDLAAYKRRSKARGRARGASGSDNGLDKNYALPYMNLEDLARGNAFLVLLNSRVRHPPSQFAVLDEQSLRFGIWAEALTPQAFYSQARRIRHGRGCWQDPKLPTGLLVLDVQATLLQALRDIVALVLQDKPLEVYAKTGPVAPELPPLSLHPREDSPSVTDLARTCASLPRAREGGRRSAVLAHPHLHGRMGRLRLGYA
ncbi:unnamed protein product [Clonostachys rosea f. rosea IK726]|uniref:Uncharacterized protein n=1 Tax=Clonostachys rosea f. rosea IK726 TaxID=1349383 RepID=A0ACA9U6G3_BIOOC|nr:unnamed protein product [Clonostachys rosea f. rosea IK726]